MAAAPAELMAQEAKGQNADFLNDARTRHRFHHRTESRLRLSDGSANAGASEGIVC